MFALLLPPRFYSRYDIHKMGKETFYFPHDYNARQDPKVKKLIQKHGLTGYGIFWALVEDLYSNANALPLDYECIAFDLRCEETVLRSVMNDFDLFILDDVSFGSMSIQRRLEERDSKSLKARESARKRWDKSDRNANALPTQSDRNAIKEIKEKKEKLFARFWGEYPVKKSKPEAQKAWMKLDLGIMETAITHIPIMISTPLFPGQVMPYPATYINQRRWEDELPGKRIDPNTPVHINTDDGPMVRIGDKTISLEEWRKQA